MQEQNLLKIALIASIIGLVILFLVSLRIEISQTQINKIDQTDQQVLIKGIVTRLTDRGDLLFLEVTAQEKITVVAFKDGVIDVEQGDAVEILGETQEYEGREEIIADELRIIG